MLVLHDNLRQKLNWLFLSANVNVKIKQLCLSTEEKQEENNDQILIIIISAAATAVALGILICGIYMLITNMRKEKKEKQEESPPPKKDIMETLKDLRFVVYPLSIMNIVLSNTLLVT